MQDIRLNSTLTTSVSAEPLNIALIDDSPGGDYQRLPTNAGGQLLRSASLPAQW